MNSLASLLAIRACPDGLKWARSSEGKEIQDYWLTCHRGDWMAWYAGKKADTDEAKAKLTAALAECGGIPVDLAAADLGLAAAKVVTAIKGNHTETMQRCADIFRKHYPEVP